jgi:hypothetical protein
VQQPEPDVEHALGAVLDKIDAFIRAGSPTGGNVTMYLAGGLAVHRYCETRHTNDIDASFSHRMLLPAKDMVAQFIGPRKESRILYLDPNYNTTFALMHPDFEEAATDWPGMNSKPRRVALKVLSPIDLAALKLPRYSEQDRDDIIALARVGGFGAKELRERSLESLGYYTGDLAPLKANLKSACDALS